QRLFERLAAVHEAGRKAPAALARVLGPPAQQNAAVPGDHRQHGDLWVTPDDEAAGWTGRVRTIVVEGDRPCLQRGRTALAVAQGVVMRVRRGRGRRPGVGGGQAGVRLRRVDVELYP